MSDFTPDAFALRTTDAEGRSYGSFQWPREIGAMVTAPDWSSKPECGYGLHGLPDGLGDYDLLNSDHDAIWWVVGFIRTESVDLDGKVIAESDGSIAVDSLRGHRLRSAGDQDAELEADPGQRDDTDDQPHGRRRQTRRGPNEGAYQGPKLTRARCAPARVPRPYSASAQTAARATQDRFQATTR